MLVIAALCQNVIVYLESTIEALILLMKSKHLIPLCCLWVARICWCLQRTGLNHSICWTQIQLPVKQYSGAKDEWTPTCKPRI